MKLRLKFFVAILIFTLTTIATCSCELFKPEERPGHTCSFDEVRVVSYVGCDSDGIIIRACSCGEERTEVSAAYGHSFGEWSVIHDSDCKQLGSKERSCSVCGAVETSAIPRPEHNYTITEEYLDGIVYNRYNCQKCSESFLIEADLDFAETEESYLTDCETDFAFTVVSYEGEAYIRENLQIINAYFESDRATDGASVEYSLTDLVEGYWLVSPATEYTEGSTYVAIRSGSVVFKDHGMCDLTFSIAKARTENAELNNEILFIGALEQTEGGYYPYNLEYSDGSGDFLLTLERADGINVGDLICLGSATCVEELIESGDEHTFGRVLSITRLNDGRMLLMLKEPTLSEVFSKLDIYTEYIKDFEEIIISDNIDEQIAGALYSDGDFAKLLSVTYDTAGEYAEARGLSAGKTFREFIESIEIDKESYEAPSISYAENSAYITTKIAIVGEAPIPFSLDGESLGSIGIKFRAYVNLNDLTVIMNMENGKFSWAGFDEGLEFSFGVVEDVTVGFSFDISTNIDYSAEAKPYILNLSSGCYHFRSCRHVGMIKDESKKLAVSTSELFELIASGEAINECQSCLPILAMKSDMYIINRDSMYYHTVKCPNAKLISEENRAFTERSSDQLIEDGFYACGTCNPDQVHFNAFDERLLQKIEYGDFGEHAKEVAKITSGMKTDDGRITIGFYAMTFTGIDREELTLSVYFDFHLEASLHYEYEINHRSLFGFRGTKDGVKTYEKTLNSEVTKNSLTLVGKARMDVGLESEITVYIKGMKRSLNGTLRGRIGLYAKVNGALNVDFTDRANDYAAAYFEAGIHVEANGTLKLPLLDPFSKQIFDFDLPLKKLGYEKVYYNYVSLPDDIVIEENYIDLDTLGLLEVKYFDLVKMNGGETSLSIIKPSEHYSVQLSMANGSYCYIKSGYLFIKDGSPAFTDIIRVKVIGLDSWNDYSKGNSKFTLTEYEIPVSYDGSLSGDDGNGWSGEDPTVALYDLLEYEISEDRSYYTVSDVKNPIKGMTIVIPETYNGLPVKGIKQYAFDGVYDLNLTIPPTIEFIKYDAFRHCTPNVVYISDLSAWCNIEFDGYTSVPIRSFDDHSSLLICNGEPVIDLVIPDGVRTVKPYAFMYYKELKSVKIADTVKELGNSCFYECDNIEKLTLGASLEVIDWAAFGNCEKITEVRLPKRLKSIAGHAFDSTSLTEISFPARLEYIGDAAFYGTNLREAIIPDSVTYLGSSAFLRCSNLRRAVIGDGVKALMSDTFGYCYNLREVDLGNIEETGTYVFHTCYNLTRVTLPASLKKIGAYAFAGCNKLVEIENLSELDIKTGYSEPGYVALHALHIYGDGGKSNLHTTSDGFVFYSDNERILLVDYIGGESEVTLPSSFGGKAYDIHDYAFACNKNITSITVPECVSAIGTECFKEVTTLEKVIFEDHEGWTRSYNYDKYGIETIGSDILSDQTKAAKYLTGDATPYYWKKG